MKRKNIVVARLDLEIKVQNICQVVCTSALLAPSSILDIILNIDSARNWLNLVDSVEILS